MGGWVDAWISCWVLGTENWVTLLENWKYQDGEILEGINNILLPWYKFPSGQYFFVVVAVVFVLGLVFFSLGCSLFFSLFGIWQNQCTNISHGCIVSSWIQKVRVHETVIWVAEDCPFWSKSFVLQSLYQVNPTKRSHNQLSCSHWCYTLYT